MGSFVYRHDDNLSYCFLNDDMEQHLLLQQRVEVASHIDVSRKLAWRNELRLGEGLIHLGPRNLTIKQVLRRMECLANRFHSSSSPTSCPIRYLMSSSMKERHERGIFNHPSVLTSPSAVPLQKKRRRSCIVSVTSP
jgi:hypothetical protein